jgi:tetratricopeptide (TPR) repeat protein
MSEESRQDAVALLERVVRQDPASPLYLPLAERLREQGRVDEAIRLCEERRARPGRVVADHVVLGRCYLAGGRLPEARAEFEAALALDRENVAALKALAGIESHEGKDAAAADLYRAVCRVDPGDLESQTALHQITSGDFPEVRPPDLVLGQGEVVWQPVRLPREEEHLPELALGLRTIETFDAEAPRASGPSVQDFREVVLDSLEIELDAESPREERAVGPGMAPVSAAPAPAASAPAPPVAPPAPALASLLVGSPEKAASDPVRDPGPSEIGAPAGAEPPGEGAGRIVQGNRSAFETWIRRLGSWESH